VSVEDDGPGMPDTEKAQAFERFFQGSRTALQATPGIGLGLPVARAIVEAHSGSIILADRPEGGLIVSFSLPGLRKLRAVS
jgi:two-component system OmpR family sensor kinase